MTALVWDKPGERKFETGVDRGVLYPLYSLFIPGVAWNGLVSIDEVPSGGELQSYWWDGKKYFDDIGSEDYQATLSAYTYPDEFEPCNGTLELQDGVFAEHQIRQMFNLSYRTKLGNDDDPDAGYRIHFVYGLTATPTQRHYGTLSDTTDVSQFSWSLNAIPQASATHKPTAHIWVDSTKVDPYGLFVLENIIYGSDNNDPTWLPQSVVMSTLLTEPPSGSLVTDILGIFV